MLAKLLSTFIKSDMDIKNVSVMLYHNSDEASICIEAMDKIDGDDVRVSRFIRTSKDIVGNMNSQDIINFIEKQRNIIDSTNKNDLVKFGKVMNSITDPKKKAYIVSECYFEHLMLLPIRQFYIGWLLKIIKFMHGENIAIDTFADIILKNDTQNEGYEDIIHQMLFGKDFSCKNSAGGFNQDELNKIQEIIEKYN